MTVWFWSACIGTVAAVSTTAAFLPQLITVKRQGGADLSAGMLGMYLGGQGLWFAYGLLNHAGAVIGANIASIVLVAAVVILKYRGRPTAPPSRRLRIAIDMDEVMADALGEHVRRYNEAFGAALTRQALHGRHLEDYAPPSQRRAVEAMLDASFFAGLDPMPGCVEVLRDLTERYDVFIVTAAMDVPCSFDAKYQWLQRHFPFVPPSHIVFCGDKSIVDADYLIDDRARHFARFKGKPVLFSAPHNAHEARYPRVASWAEVRQLFGTKETAGVAAGRLYSLEA
jgi:5'-nucleotidase